MLISGSSLLFGLLGALLGHGSRAAASSLSRILLSVLLDGSVLASLYLPFTAR